MDTVYFVERNEELGPVHIVMGKIISGWPERHNKPHLWILSEQQKGLALMRVCFTKSYQSPSACFPSNEYHPIPPRARTKPTNSCVTRSWQPLIHIALNVWNFWMAAFFGELLPKPLMPRADLISPIRNNGHSDLNLFMVWFRGENSHSTHCIKKKESSIKNNTGLCLNRHRYQRKIQRCHFWSYNLQTMQSENIINTW